MKFLILLLLIVGCDQIKSESYIDCPLIWKEATSSDPYPKESIPAAKYGQDYFISRSKVGVVGYAADGICYTFETEGSIPLKHNTYEVLTNPYNCEINWLSGEVAGNWDLPHLVLSGNCSLVGRAVSELEQRILGGDAKSNKEIFVAFNETDGGVLQEFEILQSYQSGLSVEVMEVLLEKGEVFEVTQQILAVDQIINRSPGYISQKVEHKMSLASYFSIELPSFQSWGHISELKIKFDVVEKDEDGEVSEGPKLSTFDQFHFTGLSYPLPTISGSGSALLEQEVEEEIMANITTKVEAESSIQLCSVSDIIEDFSTSFTAIAKYTGQGLRGTDIQAILLKDNLSGQVLEDSVLVAVSGLISGSLYSQPSFFSYPLEYVGPNNCYNVPEESRVKVGEPYNK